MVIFKAFYIGFNRCQYLLFLLNVTLGPSQFVFGAQRSCDWSVSPVFSLIGRFFLVEHYVVSAVTLERPVRLCRDAIVAC